MAINTQKVIVGGIAAGVVVGAFDFVNEVVLAGQREAILNALNPDLVAELDGILELGGAPPATFIAFWVVSRLMFGLLIAWTYASMRPRYGEGPKTAAFAALPFWCLLTMISAAMTLIGMFPWSLFVWGSVIGASELLIEANVAGYLYAEA